MRTLIVSDLHLGGRAGVDLLRAPAPRAALLEALQDDIDRLVLLGDVLELRHGPRHEALAAARPFFEELGRAFAGREVVVLAGNHDHALIEPWLERRSELPAAPPLGLEQRIEPSAASTMLAQLAAWAEPARLTTAYPGLWVREDVYATHGHYLDCHLTIPTLERLGIGTMGRIMRRPARDFARPDDYEAVTVPVFAWVDAIARQAPTGDALNGGLTVRAWKAFGGGHGRAGRAAGSPAANGEPPADVSDGRGAAMRVVTRALRDRFLASAFPLGVAALNRAGFGPFNADLSPGELRRAGLRAMGEMALRLGLGDAYVVFGHTHRAGPLPGDRDGEWRNAGGARLVNTGCWTYDSYFLGSAPSDNPYWPGSCVIVDDHGPPVVRRLLAEHTRAELAPAYA
ncbi:MAG TPA: metallophosphoesterase [Solirubrobacteraceae bacterium]|nr:metallophosphoesterase [Solirubrobacteraceae bacterium]